MISPLIWSSKIEPKLTSNLNCSKPLVAPRIWVFTEINRFYYYINFHKNALQTWLYEYNHICCDYQLWNYAGKFRDENYRECVDNHLKEKKNFILTKQFNLYVQKINFYFICYITLSKNAHQLQKSLSSLWKKRCNVNKWLLYQFKKNALSLDKINSIPFKLIILFEWKLFIHLPSCHYFTEY